MSLAEAWHNSLHSHTKHGTHHTMGDKAFANKGTKGDHSLLKSCRVKLLQHRRKVALGTQKLRLRHLSACFRFQINESCPMREG